MQNFAGALLMLGLFFFSIGCLGWFVLKPLLFFALFRGIGRFRLGRPALTRRECAGLAAFRAVCELPALLLVALAAWITSGGGTVAHSIILWAVLICLRAVAWLIVAAVINGLGQRSFWMLVASGVSVDVAVDAALALGLFGGIWFYVGLLVLAFVIFWFSLSPRDAAANGTDSEPGLCGACGYNLQHIRSGRCPECGQMDERASRKNYGDYDPR